MDTALSDLLLGAGYKQSLILLTYLLTYSDRQKLTIMLLTKRLTVFLVGTMVKK